MASLGSTKNPLNIRVQSLERAAEVVQYCDAKGWKVMIGIHPDESEDLYDLERKENPIIHQLCPCCKNIVRYDPCHCGSGKKYKKCCLDV